MRMNLDSVLRYLIFSTIIFALSSACSEKSKDKSDDKDKIEAEIPDSLDAETRLKYVNQKIKISPNDPFLYQKKSEILYELGDTPAAIEAIDDAIFKKNDQPEFFYLKGFYFYVNNDYDNAKKYLNKSIELGSENPETYYQLGLIHYFEKDYEKATKWYDVAIEKDSTQVTYIFAKAYIFKDQKKYDESIQVCNAALKIDSTFVKALSELHDIYRNIKNQPKLARKYNNKILAIDSLHPLANFNEGNFLFDEALAKKPTEPKQFKKLLKQAIKKYNVSINLTPAFADAYFNRGYTFFELKDYDKALKDFETVSVKNKYDERAFFMMGAIYEYYEEYEKAKENYEKALTINPKFADAKKGLEAVKAEL